MGKWGVWRELASGLKLLNLGGDVDTEGWEL